MGPLVLTLSNTKCINLTKMFENCITIVCWDVPVSLLLLSLYAYLVVLHCAFVDIDLWHVVYSFYSRMTGSFPCYRGGTDTEVRLSTES